MDKYDKYYVDEHNFTYTERGFINCAKMVRFDGYDIERGTLDWHITVQHQPEVGRKVIGLFIGPRCSTSFSFCKLVKVPCVSSTAVRWQVGSNGQRTPICWAYFDERNFPDMFWEVIEGE